MSKTKKEEYFDVLDDDLKGFVLDMQSKILFEYGEGVRKAAEYYNRYAVSEEEINGIWAILPSEVRTAIKKFNKEQENVS